MPRPAATLDVFDLPDDVLASIAARLPFHQRLQLSLVCRRMRAVCVQPSIMWRQVTAIGKAYNHANKSQRRAAANELLSQFARWLAPRAAAVEELSFAVVLPDAVESMLQTLIPVPSRLLELCEEAGGRLDKLAKLSIEWPEAVLLQLGAVTHRSTAWLGLKKLAFPAVGSLIVLDPILGMSRLTDFSLADGTLAAAIDDEMPENGATPAPNHAWLPPSLTQLWLESAGLRELPPVLGHLPRLRSLMLARNRLTQAKLDLLPKLGPSLEELNISECHLPAFPSQVSSLTGLRILYLHNAFNRNSRIPANAWQALAPLSRLVFLSISGNSLTALPPCVAAMSRLEALHVEDNELVAGLPIAPVLSGLRELLLDWQAALDSPTALRAATRLSRLALHGHRCVDEGPAPLLTVRPADAGEPLLAALAAMPALKRVDDVFGEEETVTAPVARVMWQLGRRCPAVQLHTLSSTDIGWGMAELDWRAAAGDH